MTGFDTFLTLDFETFYDKEYTLKKLTTEAYVRDPRFEAIGVGVKEGAGPSQWFTIPEFKRLPINWPRTGILAHHAHLEGLIMSHHFGLRPAKWFDTLSMARVLHGAEVGGSLRELMPMYEVGQKGHEVEDFEGYNLRDFSPGQYRRYGEYCCNDCDGEYEIFQKMMARGFPDDELDVIDLTVRMFSEPVLRLDRALVEQFVENEGVRKLALLNRAGADRSTLMSNEKFAALLLSMGEEPPKKTSTTTGEETWALAKSDPGFQALLEHEREEVRWLAEARRDTKSTINESRAARFLATDSRGAMTVYLKYGQAHTLRWAGGDKMNMQNLQRVNKKRPEVGTLRNALVAPPGDVIVAVDSGSIEARVCAWLAGQTDLLAAFHAGRDIYSEFASVAYRRKVDRKKNPDDELPGMLGKVAILGLGYQMGPKKFATTLLQGPMGAPPIVLTTKDAEQLDVDVFRFVQDRWAMKWVSTVVSRLDRDALNVHCAVAARLVEVYRKTNYRIVELWGTCQRAIRAMLGRANYPTQVGPIQIGRHKLLLPNGLQMRYRGLRELRDEQGKTAYTYMGGHKAKEVCFLYGGALTENIVQYLAREVIAQQMLSVHRKYGYRPVTTTHDELVYVVSEAEGLQCLERVKTEMKVPPSWAPGLPLTASGGIGTRYGAAK